MRRAGSMMTVAGLVLAAACASRTGERLVPRPSVGPGNVVYAGVRSSRYGIKPFPEPAGWETAMRAMTGYFPRSTPCGIWIVGTMAKTNRFTRLEFPAGGQSYPFIEFEDVDKHERYLAYFDRAGIKVFLQVEPANADVVTLIDVVLARYKRHPCVVGFGVDVEWHREADNPKRGVQVDDGLARLWEARVKSHGPEYRLFLKHWDREWMPPTYRGDIVFVDDSQIFPDFEAMVKEFTESWAPAFYPNMVIFQIGYRSDRPWWSKLSAPPAALGEAIRKGVRQELGIIWVDFTLRDVLPLGEGRLP